MFKLALLCFTFLVLYQANEMKCLSTLSNKNENYPNKIFFATAVRLQLLS